MTGSESIATAPFAEDLHVVRPRGRGDSPPSDPFFDSVVLLLGFDGADGATTSADESTHAHGSPSFQGAAQLDDAQAKFGATSLLLDGNSDWAQYLDHDDWSFGAGDFTMECFARFAVTPANQMLLSKYSTSASSAEYFLLLGTDVTFLWYDPTSTLHNITAATPEVGIGEWHHVAVDRASGHMRLYVDGVVKAEDATSPDLKDESAAPFTFDIGRRNHSGPFYWNGWIDEVRITKGVARYQGAFTPPAAAFPRS